MKRIFLSATLLFIALNVFSQFDTNYVFLTKNKFSVYPLFESSTSYFYYDFTNKNNDKQYFLSYRPRTYNSLGIGASFYRFGFSLTFELPNNSEPELNKYKAFSFKGGYSYKRFFGELRIRNYNGVIENVTYYNSIVDVRKVRKDIKITQYGANLYFFTSKKYNFDANFKNYNIQKKSAISPFVNIGPNFYSIKGDYLLSDSLGTNNNKIVTEIRSSSVRILPGIAFSIVYRSFYFSTLASFGVGFNKNLLRFNDNTDSKYSAMPVLEAGSSIGYSNEDFFITAMISLESDRYEHDNSYMGSAHVLYNIKVGKKFNIKYLGKIGKYL